MNREIKFRGKGIEEYDKDKWYYGSYFIYNAINYFCLDDGSRTKEINEKIKNNIKHKIIFEVQGDWNMENHIQLADVKPETVGQYTGLHDKNGKEIYEGDIIKYRDSRGQHIEKVIFDKGCFYAGMHWGSSTRVAPKLINTRITEVIGNIYDNPELLGGE